MDYKDEDEWRGGKVEGQRGEQSLFLPPHGASRAGLLLGFALGSHGLHGLLYGFLVTEERHGLNGLQVGIQLIHNWDSRGQVQLHDGCIRHTWTDRRVDQTGRQADQLTEQRERN